MGTSHVEVAQAKVRQAQEWVETCQRSSKEAITPDQKRRRKETGQRIFPVGGEDVRV